VQTAAICNGLRNHNPKNSAVSASIGFVSGPDWGAL